jgi:hypothetical protein
MRTRIEIPDDLFWKAKAQAALEGVRLRDLIERGLRLALAEPAPSAPRRVNFPLHRSRRPGALSAIDVRTPRSKYNVTRTPVVPMLCDVNVLLALGTDCHAAHAAAVRWLAEPSSAALPKPPSCCYSIVWP